MSPRCWDPRRTRGVPRGPPQDTDRDGPTRWGPREDAEASPDRICDPPRTRRGPQERDGRTDSGRTDRQMERGAGNGCGPERMEMDGWMGGWLDRRTDGRTLPRSAAPLFKPRPPGARRSLRALLLPPDRSAAPRRRSAPASAPASSSAPAPRRPRAARLGEPAALRALGAARPQVGVTRR